MEHEQVDNPRQAFMLAACPECGGPVVSASACQNCIVCGFSRCSG